MRRYLSLSVGFVAVHLWLFWAIKHAPNQPLYDVPHVYLHWVRRGLTSGHWVGIASPWVYPVGALVPMVAVAALGLHHYGVEWLALVTAMNGLACVVLSRSGASGRASAYWWLVFLAALGPVAVGRIDSITIPLAMIALLLLARRPGTASALLTFAACIKVWPITLLATILVASRSRLRILVGSGLVGALVFGVSVVFGASVSTLSSFLTKQSGRGLQLESPAAVPWLWLRVGDLTHVDIVWRPRIKTVEVVGYGTHAIAGALTPVMLLVFGVVCVLGVRASRANPQPAAVLGPLALALTSALIVTNKVGSPQYETWIAAPIVLGLLQQSRGGPSFRVVAVLGVLVAALTQAVYPWGYAGLMDADVSSVILITLRNALLIVLLGIAVKQLVRAARPETGLASVPSLTPERSAAPRGA